MDDCCNYYILQIKNAAGNWIDTTINSKELSEVSLVAGKYPTGSTRIILRSIKEDRAKGRRVPKCC